MQTTLKTVLQQVFDLGEELNNIRLCDIDGIEHASILDIIDGVVGKQAESMWSKLESDHPDMVKKTNKFAFPGQGSFSTPVANAEVLLQIIFMLHGKKAAAIRKSGAQSFLKVLNPDQAFIDEMKNMYEAQSVGQPTGSFLINSDKVVQHIKTQTALKEPLVPILAVGDASAESFTGAREPRSRGPIIGRDLITGEEVTFASCEKAAYSRIQIKWDTLP